MDIFRDKKLKWIWIAIVALATFALVATSFLPFFLNLGYGP